MVSKRRFLGVIGATVSTIAVAGCSSISDTGISLGRGPEATVEQFFSALESGDIDTANELTYKQDLGWDDISDITIVEITTEERTTREYFQSKGAEGDELDTAVNKTNERIEDAIDEMGVDDQTWVYFSATIRIDGNQRSQTGTFDLVNDDGDWYLHRPKNALRSSIITSLNSDDQKATGEESTQAVTQLQVQKAVGHIDSGSEISEIVLTVSKDGSQDIDLAKVVYEITAANTDATGTLETSMIDPVAVSTEDTVMTESSDRYEITFTVSDYIEDSLTESETITIILTTRVGSTSIVRLRVPDSLAGQETVSLT